MNITDTQALQRVIEHREIFHDEMLGLMRRIMTGEMSPVMVAALAMGLRVKKESIGEITASAQVMREFATPVPIADRSNLVDLCGTGGDGAHTFNISTAWRSGSSSASRGRVRSGWTRGGTARLRAASSWPRARCGARP